MEKHERLREARLQAGFGSAAEAARRLGMAYGTYSGHENGLRGMGDEDIRRYARAFKRSVAWLAFGEDETIGRTSIEIKGHIQDAGYVEENCDNTLLKRHGFGRVDLPMIVPENIDAYMVALHGYKPGMMINDIVLVREISFESLVNTVPSIHIVKTKNGLSYLGEILKGDTEGKFHVICPNSYAFQNIELTRIAEIYAIIPWSQHMRQSDVSFREAQGIAKRSGEQMDPDFDG